MIDKFKSINKAQVHYGAGRHEDNLNDQFVLTRKINHPELVFN